ncbi:MAG: SDR family oxidoreductase [Nitrospiraceae bacterium]|nr:SDR family oxidoreductase [Nitrospiraceae bacterium]
MAKVLVLGATGHVGSPLVSELVAAREQVKAASRRATPVAGAEAVRFDYADTSTFAAALEGVDRVFVLLPGGYTNPVAHLQPVIQAAADRKVKVVLQTAIGVDADDTIPYRQVELFLMRSGTRFVILRPNWFADNFHTFWLAGIKQGVLAVPAGEGKSSFIDVRDVAASTSAVLRTNRFDGNAFNLTGPTALSYDEAAAILSNVTRRTIRYQPIDDEAFIKMATSGGVPRDYATFLTGIFYPVRQGWTATVTDDVQSLTGSAPRSLETYAADHAAVLAA